MSERTRTTRVSDDGKRLIIVERWLDEQVVSAALAVEEPASQAAAV